jgi:hypothetical protein
LPIKDKYKIKEDVDYFNFIRKEAYKKHIEKLDYICSKLEKFDCWVSKYGDLAYKYMKYFGYKYKYKYKFENGDYSLKNFNKEAFCKNNNKKNSVEEKHYKRTNDWHLPRLRRGLETSVIF